MNIFAIARDDIIAALKTIVPEGTNLDAVTAEPPRDTSHGDVATNAAMVVAKQVGKNPRELGEQLATKLEDLDYVESSAVAGPGFINIKVTIEKWREILKNMNNAGIKYGDNNLGHNQKINVEYVSANPTGPMHIGHARGAVYGDVLARLLEKSGYDVTKEYYINDAGGQIDNLVKSVMLRASQSLGEDIGEFPEGLYPGEYLIPAGKMFVEEYGAEVMSLDKEDLSTKARSFAVNFMMQLIKDDLKTLGIEHDVFSSETKLIEGGKIEESLEFLETKGLIYRGVLEPPKGQVTDDWEPREQTLFKATDFGDDVDRALKKNDGSNTYFSSDIAYHHDKISRGFNEMILVLGADHGGYQKRLKAAVKALSDNAASLNIRLYQLVNFMENGVPAKMSKRAGTFLTVKDVVEKVGKDVVRFMMLTRKNDVVLDFDFKAVTEQSKDNPVFYVQYASARAHSILRNAIEEISELKDSPVAGDDDTISRLTRDEDIELIKLMAQWPRVVETAALHQEPHRVIFYLQELAAGFHAFWNKGKEDESLRFIVNDDIVLTKARLALVNALTTTIASGLHVVGVKPVEEM